MSPTTYAIIAVIVVVVLFMLFSKPTNIEARKNYLLGEIDALELGITQVAAAARRFKGETAEETSSVQARVEDLLGEVQSASLACEIMLEDANTEADLKPIQDTLTQSRRKLREARTLLGMDDEEDDFKVSDEG